MSTFIALQPCFDRQERVRAYAVAYRTRLPLELTDGADPAAATLAAVLEALLREGLPRVTGGQPGLLRIARSQLGDPQLRRLDPSSVLLVVDGTADAQAPVVAGAARVLAAAGYGLALDMPAEGPVSPALAECAKLAIVDVVGASPARVGDRLAAARALGMPVCIRNAPPGSTVADWTGVGAALVQWAALAAAPRREAAHASRVNDANALKLLGALRDPKVHDTVLEDGFKRDLALSYELLKLVNSAAVAGREVYSIGHAIRLLGRETIHRRLATLVLRSLGDRGVRGELAHRALVRGRFCELLADEAGVPKAAGPLFTTGFLSLLPDLLGIPVADLKHRVTLAPDVRDAIEQRADFYGAMLALVEAWEGERWDGVLVRAAAEGLAPEPLAARYLAAVAWAREQMGGGFAAAA
ncbi:MAG: HDOD domain-containing protein [Gemmatimonadaceae bacterium]|nr:HDOD domain-containing protein [Gemmatimonadaceae bacterium]